ncbi:MAG TPA: MoxR family ATPase [Thermoanaerobaculia bacterium]|nr:MoxR family ATPase [Thermoanaerobaculia bacterium]
MIQDAERRIAELCASLDRVRAEVGKIIVGNEDVLDALLTCLLADGHALLEGIPGLGKSRLVSTLAAALQLEFSRVQFTPDLMPADIVGTNIVQEDEHRHRSLVFQRGPVFAHLLLADEINRATPKTQSALLEAMQEKTVSVGRVTHRLELPFFVLATQNPLEMEGTYPLPEAQLDRFLMKLRMRYPDSDELHQILARTTEDEPPEIQPVLDREAILELRHTVRSLPVVHEVRDYAIRLVLATHPDRPQAPGPVKRYVRFGASPRGAQALILGAKVRALSNDRAHVAADDIAALVHPALRHRLLLNFEGEASGVDPDTLLDEVLSSTPPP